MTAGSAMAQERVQPPAPAPGDAGTRPSTIIVPIGGTRPLQMKPPQPITQAENLNERVLEVRTVQNTPETVLLLGKDAGTSRLTLTGLDRSTQTFEVIVQLDVDYLRSILQRAVPTANITLIPIHNNTVIISGTVNHAEDIAAILATANAVLGAGAGGAPGAGSDRVINRLTLAGVQQVQLDCVVAFVNRTLARTMGVDFFSNGPSHVRSDDQPIPCSGHVAHQFHSKRPDDCWVSQPYAGADEQRRILRIGHEGVEDAGPYQDSRSALRHHA